MWGAFELQQEDLQEGAWRQLRSGNCVRLLCSMCYFVGACAATFSMCYFVLWSAFGPHDVRMMVVN